MAGEEGFSWKRTVTELFIVAFLILSAASVGTSQPSQPEPPQNIYGNVTYADSGGPVGGANVSVVDEYGNVDGYGMTDPNGYYDFNFQGSGTYYVFVNGENSSETLEYSSGGSTRVNVSYSKNLPQPEITTGPATNVNKTSGRLGGYVDLKNRSISVKVRFAYDKPQNTTRWLDVNSSASLYHDRFGLEPGTKYSYTAQMKYSGTVYNGSTRSFTTDSNTTGGSGGSGTGTGTSSSSGGFTGGFTGGGSGGQSAPSPRLVNVSAADGSFSSSIGDLKEGQKVVIDVDDAKVIDRIQFTALENVNGTGIEYRYLGLNRPKGVEEPSPLIYSYEAVTFTGMDDSDFVNATVDFSVSRDWFDRSKASVGDVRINRYHDGWRSYRTVKTGEGRSSYSFRARTPGFSYFAVASGNVDKKPDINVKNVKIAGQQVAPASLNATVVVENVGTSAGTETVSLNVDGEKRGSKTVRVGSGGVASATFQLQLGEGKHAVSSGGVTKDVQVETPQKGGFPWAIVLLVVALAGAAGVAYYYYGRVHSPGMEEAVDMKRVSSIQDLKKNEGMYLDEEIKLSGVKVDPIEKTEDGWRYIISDNTGRLEGVSPQKTQGRGSIGGPLKKQNGELYIVF